MMHDMHMQESERGLVKNDFGGKHILTCIALDIFCVDRVMGDIELLPVALEGVSRQLLRGLSF